MHLPLTQSVSRTAPRIPRTLGDAARVRADAVGRGRGAQGLLACPQPHVRGYAVMNGHWLTALMIGALILLNALFAGSEIAGISLREGQLRQLEHRTTKAASTLVALAQEPTRFLATIQLGITLSGFLASATAAVSLAEPLVALAGVPRPGGRSGGHRCGHRCLDFPDTGMGGAGPKRIAMQHAQRWALWAARPLRALALVLRPAVWALGAATDVTVRALGCRPDAVREQPSRDELREVVAGHPGLHPEQRRSSAGPWTSNSAGCATSWSRDAPWSP